MDDRAHTGRGEAQGGQVARPGPRHERIGERAAGAVKDVLVRLVEVVQGARGELEAYRRAVLKAR